MTYARTTVQDFSTANKLYVNAIVTFWKVVDGEKTNLKADLYNSLSGNDLLANPQTLDSHGKFKVPVYIQDPVIMTVTGLGNTPDHDTGVVAPANFISGLGSPQGVVIANRGAIYSRTDGGVGSTLYVKEAGDGLATGWSAK